MKNIVIPEKLKSFFNTTGKVIVITASMVVGFGVAQLYNYVTKKEDKPATIQVNPGKSMAETSIAINERNELMVIDRKNGSYQIYSDSVGHAIFNLYAGQYYAKMSQK